MDTRLVIHELEAAHRLDAEASRRLDSLAGLRAEPAALQRVLPLGLAALAAVLIGLGLVFWVAANWDSLGRFGRFALLQGVVVVTGIAAVIGQPPAFGLRSSPLGRPGGLMRADWRAPPAVLVFLATGALFAYFGQTYQTGADPWQLFALWAALTLPLALGLRSDLVWTPWVVVSFVAVAMWVHAHGGHRWSLDDVGVAVHLLAWGAAGLVVAATSGLGRRFTGAGIVSLRTAVTLAVVLITGAALAGVLRRHVAMTYPPGLAALGLLAAAFVPVRRFDVYALSAVALGLVTLAVAGLGRLLFEGSHGDPIGRIFMLGVAAAGLLAAAVNLVLRVARAHAAHGADAAHGAHATHGAHGAHAARDGSAS